MTTILAIDTATSACSVALYRHGTSCQRFVATPREHTRMVLPMVDSLLEEADISLSEVDALAFSAGPGSFTGLRIGFGVIQGLAFGADLPVIPISTLAALALAGSRRSGLKAGLVLPALDARMGEIYWGLYRYENNTVDALMDDRVARPELVAPSVVHTPDLGVGDGWQYLVSLFDTPAIDKAATPDAVSVAELALPRFGRGEALSIDQVVLTYIRNEVSWKKREKIRRV